jgi:hypothetical protein
MCALGQLLELVQERTGCGLAEINQDPGLVNMREVEPEHRLLANGDVE